MGKAKSFQGIQTSSRIAFQGFGEGVYIPHWLLLGLPLPSQGSRVAVSSEGERARTEFFSASSSPDFSSELAAMEGEEVAAFD